MRGWYAVGMVTKKLLMVYNLSEEWFVNEERLMPTNCILIQSHAHWKRSNYKQKIKLIKNKLSKWRNYSQSMKAKTLFGDHNMILSELWHKFSDRKCWRSCGSPITFIFHIFLHFETWPQCLHWILEPRLDFTETFQILQRCQDEYQGIMLMYVSFIFLSGCCAFVFTRFRCLFFWRIAVNF